MTGTLTLTVVVTVGQGVAVVQGGYIVGTMVDNGGAGLRVKVGKVVRMKLTDLVRMLSAERLSNA